MLVDLPKKKIMYCGVRRVAARQPGTGEPKPGEETPPAWQSRGELISLSIYLPHSL